MFGLKTGGRVESILMSLPPTVRYWYGYHPEAGTKEAELTEYWLKPKDWADVNAWQLVSARILRRRGDDESWQIQLVIDDVDARAGRPGPDGGDGSADSRHRGSKVAARR